MALRPTTKPRFASVDYNNGPLGGANVTEPSEPVKDKGWEAGEKPPREYFNWLHRLYYQWIDYLDELALNSVQKTNNLSDIPNVATARTNLGLGTAAVVNTGTGAANVPTVAQADARFTQRSNNLADVASVSSARSNLGLGTAATLNAGANPPDVVTNSTGDTRYVRTAGATMTGNLAVPDAVSSGHAINLGQADTRYINAAGDTMSGALIVPAAAAGNHAMNRDSSDVRYVSKSGDTMSGNLSVPNASSSAHALNLGQADGRYLQGIPQATDVVSGIVQFATPDEARDPNYNGVALTPRSLLDCFASESRIGTTYLASNANSNNGSSGSISVTPQNFSSAGQQLKAINGYQRLPGGLILQWGVTGLLDNVSNTVYTLNFPIAFPNACLNITANVRSTAGTLGSGSSMSVFVDTLSASQFRILLDAANGSFQVPAFWHAIGH